MGLADVQCIHDAQHVVRQLVQRIVAARRFALAMAAGVNADHPVFVGQSRQLRLPHGAARAQRVAHDQGRAIGGPILGVGDANAIRINELNHEESLSNRSSDPSI